MSGVLSDVRVLDLSWGVAGPMSTMLLADHGADVIKVEPPGGDPFRTLPAYRVWNRGKRSAVIDLKQDLDQFLDLATTVDVLVESFSPGTTDRLGIDYETLAALNPRLIYCSITGYGRDNQHSDRPGYDGLVAARTGLVWEKRGFAGGSINRLAGLDVPFADLDVPEGAVEGPPRDGPLFSASPTASLGACYLATTAISAALRARELTGRGQWVETSLLQGVLAATLGGWQRVERPDTPGYQTWIFDGRAPMLGIFQCADGRWVHNWVANPRFILSAAAGDTLAVAAEDPGHRDDPDRIGTDPANLVVVWHYWPQLVEAFAKFPSADWVRVAAEFGTPLQPVRSPAEALRDDAWLADGCVARIQDPDAGAIRMVGSTYRLTTSAGLPSRPAPGVGEHTDDVLAERRPQADPTPASARLAAPLAGVKVLDLGLAIAGPYGAQILADLGADVIKVNGPFDKYWQGNHVAFVANRNKRSLGVNLQSAEGLAVLHRLVRDADVVHHNMRYDAAERLGVDYDSLRAINPALIYCHTRGFEHGDRDPLPANDQTGAALAGNTWEDGGASDGGRPMWSRTSFGDTGNGFLSAIGVIQALYHRDRTGEGQFVDTSIVYAQLLNSSYTYVDDDGAEPDRPRLDALHYGLGALYRLYETADGWLFIAALTEAHWQGLRRATGREELLSDARFATADLRRTHDAELARVLADTFAAAPADKWFQLLDDDAVPCEIASDGAVFDLFDDPELFRRRWLTAYEHPAVGRIEQCGLGFDLSDTPGVIWGPTPVVGQHTEEILNEAGYSAAEVQALIDAGAVWPAEPLQP